jgi:hypothetical protein
MFRAKRRLGPGELALVPRLSNLAVGFSVNMHVHLDSSFFLEEKLERACWRECPMSALRPERTTQVEITRDLGRRMTLSGPTWCPDRNKNAHRDHANRLHEEEGEAYACDRVGLLHQQVDRALTDPCNK